MATDVDGHNGYSKKDNLSKEEMNVRGPPPPLLPLGMNTRGDSQSTPRMNETQDGPWHEIRQNHGNLMNVSNPYAKNNNCRSYPNYGLVTSNPYASYSSYNTYNTYKQNDYNNGYSNQYNNALSNIARSNKDECDSNHQESESGNHETANKKATNKNENGTENKKRLQTKSRSRVTGRKRQWSQMENINIDNEDNKDEHNHNNHNNNNQSNHNGNHEHKENNENSNNNSKSNNNSNKGNDNNNDNDDVEDEKHDAVNQELSMTDRSMMARIDPLQRHVSAPTWNSKNEIVSSMGSISLSSIGSIGGAGAGGGASKKRRRIRLPKCKVGDSMECAMLDEGSKIEYRLCDIVAVRRKQGKDDKDIHVHSGFEYYVHYKDFNRRLDSWVDGSRLRKPTGNVLKPTDCVNGSNISNVRLTRGMKRALADAHHIEESESLDPESLKIEEIYQKTNKIKNIDQIQMGKYLIDCWYFSPYPEDYAKDVSIMYICEYCLKYMKYGQTYLRHKIECPFKHPPGNEIYRHNGISVWEIDGSHNKIYCQNLCLLAKLFFDHKTLYFDVDPFLFYIITEYNENENDCGYEMVGYFSKEKKSPEGYNLACILTLPQHQRKGYGRFIIELSYQLSKREDKSGSPEKPLSDLGKISYRSYWIETILRTMYRYRTELAVETLVKETAIDKNDVIDALQEVNMISNYKGMHIVQYREENIKAYLNEVFDPAKEKREALGIVFNAQYLKWQPLRKRVESHQITCIHNLQKLRKPSTTPNTKV